MTWFIFFRITNCKAVLMNQQSIIHFNFFNITTPNCSNWQSSLVINYKFISNCISFFNLNNKFNFYSFCLTCSIGFYLVFYSWFILFVNLFSTLASHFDFSICLSIYKFCLYLSFSLCLNCRHPKSSLRSYFAIDAELNTDNLPSVILSTIGET